MKKYSLAVIFICLFSFSIFAQTASPRSVEVSAKPANSSAVARFDAFLEKNFKPDEPGVAVMVIKNGEVKYQRSRGLADVSAKKTISLKTPFYIASLGKQFTAAAVMILADNKKLSYDDKLVKYFPEFETFAPDVSIRQLLTHTSGLIDHLDIMKENVEGWTNKDVVELLKKENRLRFQPGEKWGYSNSGYVLLAMIVEKASGKSFSEFLEENIFRPLDMKKTYVADRKDVKIPGRARGYVFAGGEWVVADYNALTVGAGGIYSTLEDLEKWDRSFYTTPLIKAETIKLASVPATLNNGKPTPYGFGWMAEFAPKGNLANVWYVASFGDFKGFKSFIKRIPEKKFTVIVLSNHGKFPWAIVELAEELYAN